MIAYQSRLCPGATPRPKTILKKNALPDKLAKLLIISFKKKKKSVVRRDEAYGKCRC